MYIYMYMYGRERERVCDKVFGDQGVSRVGGYQDGPGGVDGDQVL